MITKFIYLVTVKELHQRDADIDSNRYDLIEHTDDLKLYCSQRGIKLEAQMLTSLNSNGKIRINNYTHDCLIIKKELYNV
ncbi:hypothetical protein [Pedobacter nutrimenti]|uniref:Uncharacterized protein n=1 Tax=Pedobacter nutrimenti TaxID=1241337 RepID=A0A318U6A5_9SPHI|nr:hypothetical protein [Pedobacter nutrimenti]PYF68461.1 hypothetical protein B0O44_11248 [Pedobacter nutrimenti]